MRTESVIANIFLSFSLFFFFLTFSLLPSICWTSPNTKSKTHLFNFSMSLFSQENKKPNLNTVNSIVPFPFFYPPAEMLGLFMKTVTVQDSVVCGVEEGSLLGNIRPPYSGEGPQLVSFFSLFVFCCKTKHGQPLFPTAECWLKS